MKKEELLLLTKKELILEYKRVYNTDTILSGRTKALIIADILELQKYIARSKAIDKIKTSK